MKLSVVIPAHNEAGQIRDTVTSIAFELDRAAIRFEILVVNDHSSDATGSILTEVQATEVPQLRTIENKGPGGFGFAVRAGLDNFDGDAVAIVMADCSDLPSDIVRFFREIEKGYDCAFGTRWSPGGNVHDYPWVKLILNRVANVFIQVLFQLRYNDVTNAFKMYRKHVLEGLQPLLAHHFNLTVELPLKSIVRGYSYSVIPNTWTNRKEGVSKFRIREMGSRYLFIIIYCFIEKWLSRGDYHRRKSLPAITLSSEFSENS